MTAIHAEPDPVAFTAGAARRAAAASRSALPHDSLYGLGAVRHSAADVPRLLALINDERCRTARVRTLHDCAELPGGRLLCTHCTTPGRPVTWPCETLRLLDGDSVT